MAAKPPTPTLQRPVDTRVQVAKQNLARAEQAAAATPSGARKPDPPILTADRLKGAEFERVIHTAAPAVGHTMEHMLTPAYWAHVAPKLKPWDRVEVRAEDGTFYAELLVLACDRTWARMHVLRWDDLSTQDVSLTEASQASASYEVKFTPNLRWHVIRKLDRQVMHKEAQTRADAELWLREHLKVVPA